MVRPTFSVVMLAGSIRFSRLQEAVGIPPLCLELATGRTLLRAWLDAFAATPGWAGTLIMVNTDEERRLVEAAAGTTAQPVDVQADPASWRGMAGLVRDVRESMPPADLVMAVEAHALPPSSLRSVVAELAAGCDGVVAADSVGDAAGIYGFTHDVVKQIRPVGYCDLKEQFIPDLHAAGRDIRAVCVTDRLVRIRTLDGYLEAIRVHAEAADERVPESVHGSANGTANGTTKSATNGTVNGTAPASGGAAGGAAEPHGRATVHGACVLDPEASVASSAIVDASVVMKGAVVGPRALVSRSVLGPDAVVEAGERVVGRILGLKGAARAI